MRIFGWARKRLRALDKLEIAPTSAQEVGATPGSRPWVELTPKQVEACIDASYYYTAWSSDLDVPVLVSNLSAALKKANT